MFWKYTARDIICTSRATEWLLCTDADVSNIFEYARYLNGESIKHFSVTRDGKSSACYIHIRLTLKHRETHGCVVSTVATDALVLKHQAISILSTD